MMKMNVMIQRWVASGAVAVAMAFGATSCEDDFGKGGNRDDGTIRFEVVDDNIFVIGDGSRADEAPVTVVQSDPIRYFSEIVGEDTIPMSVTESHNSSSRLMGCDATAGKPESRGTYYNKTTEPITKFRGVAYTDGGKLFFNEDMTVGTGNIVNTGRFWPATDALTFFGYAKSNDNGKMESLAISNTSTEHKITFSYTMPEAGAKDASENFIDAQNQPDLVFAIVPGQKKTAENKNVPMPFHHALSAITFKVGKMPTETKVKSIALTGCYTSGKCIATSASTEKQSDVAFTWSNCTGAVRYEQSFNQEVTSDEHNPQQLGNVEHTFLLIPQTYGDTQKLVITFQIKEYTDPSKPDENTWHTYTMEKPMKEIIAAIEADRHYTFTIGIEKDEVDVKVEDEVVGKVKQNVTITNTGIASGYVRAAIVGYWLRTEDIMIPWSVDDTSTGKLTVGGEWETYWVKGTDGYFYYKQELKRGQQTYPLFVTYELTAGAAPVEGALLEINILAQIVHKDYLSGAWTIPPGTP